MKHVLAIPMMALALAAMGAGVRQPVAMAQEAPARVTGRFLLTDQDGRTVNEESFRGKLRVMTFGYTYCPDVCPTTLSTMAEAMDKLGSKSDQVVPIFVSVDPGRDTAPHLKAYMSAFGPAFVGLTGTPEAIASAARNFRARYQINPPTGSDPTAYSVDHSAGIYIMDREGQFLAKLGYLESADILAERVSQALK